MNSAYECRACHFLVDAHLMNENLICFHCIEFNTLLPRNLNGRAAHLFLNIKTGALAKNHVKSLCPYGLQFGISHPSPKYDRRDAALVDWACLKCSELGIYCNATCFWCELSSSTPRYDMNGNYPAKFKIAKICKCHYCTINGRATMKFDMDNCCICQKCEPAQVHICASCLRDCNGHPPHYSNKILDKIAWLRSEIQPEPGSLDGLFICKGCRQLPKYAKCRRCKRKEDTMPFKFERIDSLYEKRIITILFCLDCANVIMQGRLPYITHNERKYTPRYDNNTFALIPCQQCQRLLYTETPISITKCKACIIEAANNFLPYLSLIPIHVKEVVWEYY